MIEQIGSEAYDARVRASTRPVVVVDFFGQTCPPCQKLLPILEVLAAELDDDVDFVKVDAAEAEDLAVEFGVTSVPTVVFFKDGGMVGKIVGLTAKSKLASAIQDLLSQ